MPTASAAKVCVNCMRDENLVPQIKIHFQGSQVWICSQCFPVLIHKPAQLAGRLEGAADLDPSPHEHD